MLTQRQRLVLYLGILAFCLGALLDTLLTLKGLNGDLSLEANPLLRALMARLGAPTGLLVGKAAVLIAITAFATATIKGVTQNAPWVYYLAFFPFSRAWMRRKKRYWIAYLPLYLAALAQMLAAGMWLYTLGG